MIYVIFLLSRELWGGVNPEETTPIRIKMFHHDIQVISQI